MINADPTGAFGDVQLVVLALAVLAVLGTAGLYLLGLPLELSGIVFVVLFALLLAAGWSRIERAHPRHERTDGE